MTELREQYRVHLASLQFRGLRVVFRTELSTFSTNSGEQQGVTALRFGRSFWGKYARLPDGIQHTNLITQPRTDLLSFDVSSAHRIYATVSVKKTHFQRTVAYHTRTFLGCIYTKKPPIPRIFCVRPRASQ